MNIKTKIICTVGPSSDKEEVFEQLILNGADIIRLNFSHASYKQFLTAKDLIQRYNSKHKKEVKILIDLQGPRMRVGILPERGINLKEGSEILFSTDISQKDALFIDDPYLHLNIEPGHPIYLANGEMELMVTDKSDSRIKAKVIRGGVLYSKKGINFPQTNLTTGGLTEKDIKDIEFGLKNNTDYIALSFVKDRGDVNDARALLADSDIQIISKIERQQAIDNLPGIIDSTDIIMVARGDLGIEMPLQKLPILQKEIIKKARMVNKPAIVATQMLASMVNHYRPTRAEVSDIANAVLDGAWGLMLSDETAFGKYPIESLRYLVKTVKEAEEYNAIEE